MSYCRLFVIVQFVNDLEASGRGPCVRTLTIFPLYDGGKKKIYIYISRGRQTDSLRAEISTMMSPISEAALLNLTAILLTICPLIMERGISP